MKNIVFSVILLAVAAGCRSNEKHPPAAIPKGEKVHLTINMNVEEKVSAVPAKKVPEKRSAAAVPVKKVKKEKRSVAVTDPKKKNQHNTSRENVSTRGVEHELNDVERQYIRDIRTRNQQQQRDSAKRVFSGFSGEGIFKRK